MNVKLFLNPYEHFSEKQLLIFGVLITLLGSFVAFIFNGRFDGVIDMHTAETVELHQPLIDNCINIICLVVPLYAFGGFINKKTRVIDVFNAVLLSRAPFYLLPLFNVNDQMHRNGEEMLSSVMEGTKPEFWQVFAIVIFGVIAIAALVLFVYWLYIGFKTATNSKKLGHKFVFAGCVIIAEVVSKIVFSML